jgi:hypothetical protein
MSENRELKRIFGPKREEVVGGWRKLHNEELHSFSVSPNIIRVIKSRRMRQLGHVEHMGEINAYNILTGKPEGKRQHVRYRHRWEENIRMDLGESGWEGVDRMHLAQDRDQ